MNAYAGLVIGTTPDSAFEEEFLAIPEVRLFTMEYPNYTASHGGDFLGWKSIIYRSDGEPAVVMYVKKSVLHQGVRISAGCDGGQGFALDVPREAVVDHIKNYRCLEQ